MQYYTADKLGQIFDKDGAGVLKLQSLGCSRKMLIMAAKELANTLSNIERGKEAARNKYK